METRIEILNNSNPVILHINKYRYSFFQYQKKSSRNEFKKELESLLNCNLTALRKLRSTDYKRFERILEKNIGFIQNEIEPLKMYNEKKGEYPKAFLTSYKLEKNVLSFYSLLEEKYQDLQLLPYKTLISLTDKAIIFVFIHYKETPEIKDLRLNNLSKFVELQKLIFAEEVNFKSFRSLVNKARAESNEYNEISPKTEKILLERGFQLGIPVKEK